MKQLKLKSVAAAVALALSIGPALAGKLPPFMLGGTVTSVAGGQIVINGKSYGVQVQGTALQELEQVHAGQQVDVILNGPPGSAATQVVAIHVHNAS